MSSVAFGSSLAYMTSLSLIQVSERHASSYKDDCLTVRMAINDNALDSRCLDYDSYSTGFYCLFYSNGDLLCEAFLNLQAATECFCHAC